MTNAPTTVNIPKNSAERRMWIVIQLRLRGTSLRRLAAETGVSQQAMSAALTGPSSYLEEVIAGALGLTPQQLFPERFTETGVRLHWTREPQRTTRRRVGNVQSEEVA